MSGVGFRWLLGGEVSRCYRPLLAGNLIALNKIVIGLARSVGSTGYTDRTNFGTFLEIPKIVELHRVWLDQHPTLYPLQVRFLSPVSNALGCVGRDGRLVDDIGAGQTNSRMWSINVTRASPYLIRKMYIHTNQN